MQRTQSLISGFFTFFFALFLAKAQQTISNASLILMERGAYIQEERTVSSAEQFSFPFFSDPQVITSLHVWTEGKSVSYWVRNTKSSFFDALIGIPVTCIERETQREYQGIFPTNPLKQPILQLHDGGMLYLMNLHDYDIRADSLPFRIDDTMSTVFCILDPRKKQHTIQLLYFLPSLKGGFTYAGFLHTDSTYLTLQLSAQITNHTGRTFRNAQLQLLVGESLAFAQDDRMMKTALLRAPGFAQTEEAPQVETAFEYYRFRFPNRIDIPANSTTNRTLFVWEKIPVNIQYRFSSHYSAPLVHTRPTIHVRLVNTKTSGIGIPLPQAEITMYSKEEEMPLPIAQTVFPNTAVDDTAKLQCGQTFDLRTSVSLQNIEQFGKTVEERTFRVNIVNQKNRDVEVVYEFIAPDFGTTEFLESSIPILSRNGNRYIFLLPAKAKATSHYTFRVRHRKPS